MKKRGEKERDKKETKRKEREKQRGEREREGKGAQRAVSCMVAVLPPYGISGRTVANNLRRLGAIMRHLSEMLISG